jgi:hypothetical protein
MPGSPIPRSENELVPWLSNFGQKISNYAAVLGITVPEAEQTQTEIDYLIYLLNVRLPHERQTVAATVEYKNFIMNGDPTIALPATLPGTVPPPAYPAQVLPGVISRLRKLIQTIKNHPAYTETIGQDLDILSATTAYPEAPTITLTQAAAGAVTIGWNKAGWSGVRFQSRAKGGEWSDLGIDLHSPFVDTRPLATPFQPEGREYRASYLDGDTPQATFSQVLEVTVAP